MIGTAYPFALSGSEDVSLPLLGLPTFSRQPRHKTNLTLTWSLPPFPYVKLKVDGSSLGNPGISGVGGIIRGHHGQVKGAFSSFYGFHTNMEAEAMALLEGLWHCKTLGSTKVIVQMDSQQVLNSVNHTSPSPWRIDGVLRQIRLELATADLATGRSIQQLTNSQSTRLIPGNLPRMMQQRSQKA
ncbi:uncharacterized protein LOC113780412 [Coffea eugenioides]|uniref:uncharacterized protein LOC113780412 n=1 Tax=Coffea eugenioides TaxID=49369 RepID=UPI000F61388D|nr:uncharacterized protein LOC113780412 [Coffea eugenioides]